VSRHARRARLLVTALSALVALLVSVGASMPAYARLLGGPAAHVCHCEPSAGSGHAACACPICFSELNDVDAFGAPTVAGRCGTDDAGWRTLSDPAVPSVGFVVLAPAARVAPTSAWPLEPPQWRERPELPPPRA
jgi:hypothetical protein